MTISDDFHSRTREEIQRQYLSLRKKGSNPDNEAEKTTKRNEFFRDDVTIPLPLYTFDLEDWDETSQIHIPDIKKFKHYYPDEANLEALDTAMRLNQRVWISGNPSVGKSSLVEYYCAVHKVPFYRFNCRGDMEAGSLLGSMVVEDGETRWVDGVFTECWTKGGICLLDEPTAMPPEIEMTLRWALEDDGKLLLADKPGKSSEKILKAHPTFRLVAADNTRGLGDEHGDFAGTNSWNIAALDRFGVHLRQDYLPRHKEIAMLIARFPDATKLLCELTIDFANLVRVAYAQREVSLPCGPRTLFNIIQNALVYKDVKRAIYLSYQSKLPSDAEVQAVNGFVKTAYGI